MAIAGSTASRASDFPNDHPAILIAVSSPGAPAIPCRARKKPYGRPVRLLSRPPLYGSRRASTITQDGNGFMAPRQYCGRGITGMELRMCGSYIGRAATGVQRRNNNNGEIEMPTVTWDHVHLRSPDPEGTAAWLQDILGGEIVRGPGRIDVKLGGANVFIAPVAAG